MKSSKILIKQNISYIKRIFKRCFLIILLIGGVINFQAQISKPYQKKSKLKPIIHQPLYTSGSSAFEKIIKDIDNGVCYGVAMVSLQVDPKDVYHNSFNIETRHGKGFLEKDGQELKAVFPLYMGLKQTRHQQTVQTTLRINKDKKNARLDIRNPVYYHLFYNVKIIKKKNGYFITVEKNYNSSTVSFTFAIYKVPCLI